jgi:hypothetical protein
MCDEYVGLVLMIIPSFLIDDLVPGCKKSNTTDATRGAVTADPSETPDFTLGFCRVRGAQPFALCVVFYRSLFVRFRLTSVSSVLPVELWLLF